MMDRRTYRGRHSEYPHGFFFKKTNEYDSMSLFISIEENLSSILN